VRNEPGDPVSATTASRPPRPTRAGASSPSCAGVRDRPDAPRGLGLTLLLALLGTAGQIVVPIAVQQVIDREVSGAGAIEVPPAS
jgi:ATP-binding cassette, subfamily B, bacterial